MMKFGIASFLYQLDASAPGVKNKTMLIQALDSLEGAAVFETLQAYAGSSDANALPTPQSGENDRPSGG